MPGDPFYDRKPVPNELIQDVGYTGLSTEEELAARERKLSSEKGDLRKFWNPKNKDGKLDTYYQRKPVPDALIKDVGDTGLTREEEYMNRERKYSANGTDVRRFGDNDKKGGFHPTDDPYYGRKQVPTEQLDGVGVIPNMTPAQQFQVREQKEAAVDLSSDPFAQITGSGHRASIVDAGAVAYANSAQQAGQRRRSSAVAPDHAHQAHGGYGETKLAPVQSRTEDEVTPAPSSTHGSGAEYGNATVKDGTGHATGETGHTSFYDAATTGLDGVAPHEKEAGR